MSAGQFVSVDQRLRIPIAALALATTFLIGAVAGATLPSIVGGTGHAIAGSVSPIATTATHTDMSSAAYAAQLQFATTAAKQQAATTATHTDMSSAAYAAQLQFATTAAKQQAATTATHTDMSSAAYAAQHPAVGASSSTRGDMTSAANLNHRAR